MPPKNPDDRTVRCTACRAEVTVGVEDLGHTVECPLCGEKFRTESERRSRNSDRRPSRRSSRDDDNDDDDDDDYEDRDYGRGRRRRGFRETDKRYILDTARGAVAGPGNGLLWTGGIMLVLYELGALLLLVLGVSKLESNSKYERDDAVVFLIMCPVCAILGGAHGLILAISGHKMKQLRGTGWGYTGAALGIATIALSHPCFPTTWAAVSFGIWAVIAMSKREVQDAIRINTGKGL